MFDAGAGWSEKRHKKAPCTEGGGTRGQFQAQGPKTEISIG